jgi:hypothetical protein
MRKLLLTTLLPVLATLFCAFPCIAQPASKTDGGDEFAGKIVTFVLKSRESPPRQVVLENVRLIELKGTCFVAGTGIKRSKDDPRPQEWWQGLPVRVAFDTVEWYFPLTPEQFRSVRAREKPPEPEGGATSPRER